MENFNQTLITWGNSQRQMPAEAHELKAKILAKAATLPQEPKRHFSNFRIPVFLLSGAAVVVLGLMVLQSNTLPKSQNIQTEIPNSSSLSPTVTDSLESSLSQRAPQIMNEKTATSLELRDVERLDGGLYINKQSPSTYYNMGEEISAKDQREFLKISYSASISSRNVSEASDKTKTILTGLDGRIDSYSTNQDQAYISFVMPAKNLEAFKLQIKDLAGKKFYIESVNAQNLLSQKQDLENQTKTIQESFNTVKEEQENLTKTHKATISSLQGQLSFLNSELVSTQKQLEQNQLNVDIRNKVEALKVKISNVRQSITNENASYDSQKYWYEQEEKNINQNLENVKQQDQDLMDKVATVTGTIRIEKINLAEYINTYLPFYLSVPFVIIMLMLWLILKKDRQIHLP